MGKQIVMKALAQKRLYYQIARFYGLWINDEIEQAKNLLKTMEYKDLDEFILFLDNIDENMNGIFYINKRRGCYFFSKEKNQTIITMEEMMKEAMFFKDCDAKRVERKSGKNVVVLRVTVNSDNNRIVIDNFRLERNKRDEKREPYCRSKFKEFTYEELLKEIGTQYTYRV